MVISPQKVMKHVEFVNRIRKSLYYGVGTVDSDMEVSLPFAEYASEMFSKPHRGHSLHRLSCVAAANMQATPCSLIMALIYLDRLNITDPGYSCRITPQELFVVSLMISTKFYAGHDERFYLEDWATEGHMTEERLKEIELEFLSAMDWNIYISSELFFDKLKNIERSLAKRQGLRRGWLTYSELSQMMPSLAWTKFLLNSISVLAMSYAASVITVAGAFFIASQVPGTLWHRGVNTAPESASHSLKPASSATSVINGEYSVLLLNLEQQLLKLKQNWPEEVTKIHYSSHHSVTYLPLKNNFRKLELILSQESAEEKSVYITSHYTACETRNSWIQIGNRWKHAINVSVFWQVITM
ncbi:protein CNPPD1 isoform X2 [Drosophila biarmipes]|uniref:protein CNPPD1 isoform X2 n=1 Tax=Drosophila biarmipes TaxID=125945 RepID=UPI0007E8A32F|nr:protein CNPPD1 isoform X2 [Drosophila biarmipes]